MRKNENEEEEGMSGRDSGTIRHVVQKISGMNIKEIVNTA
jgi:hypothetical protein